MTHAYKSMGQAYEEVYGLIPEGYEGNILTHLKDIGIVGRFFYGSLVLRKKDVSKAKAHIKKGYNDPGTLVTKHKMPKIVAAEYDPTLDEASKYLHYSNLLLQKGKLLGKGLAPDSMRL